MPRRNARDAAKAWPESMGSFLMDELKPYIDRKYRTKPDAEFTGLGGSSLGGLVTLTIGILYPQVFSRLIVMSPSIWWDDFAIYRLVDSIEQKPPLKIWLDTGTAEPGWEQARELLNRLLEKGWKLQKDLQYMEAQGRRSQRSGLGSTGRTGATVFVSANKIEFSRLPAEPAADSAAMAQEAAWESVESAWAVMGLLAFVGFRVIWSEIETFFCCRWRT